MKSIRQIAQEIGVSKTAISKEIAALGLRSTLQLNGNQFLVGEEEEAQIKDSFARRAKAGDISRNPARDQVEGQSSQEEREDDKAEAASTDNQAFTEIVGVLQTTIQALEKQLDVKDHQIEQQAHTITRLSDSLAAAQTLHAESIKAQLLAAPDPAAQEEKKGWWARHFGRK